MVQFVSHWLTNYNFQSYVEYVIQRYDSPMGVATYKTSADMPEKLRKALPSVDALKEIMRGEI